MTFKDNKPEAKKHIDSDGNENFGYLVQPGMVNTNQQVATIKNSIGTEQVIGSVTGATSVGNARLSTVAALMALNPASTIFVRLLADAADNLKVSNHDINGIEIEKRSYRVTLHIDNLAAVGTYHLVDLSDFATYPHPDPSSDTDIIVRSVKVEINGNTAFRGDIHIGYLSDVDADNGNFEHLMGWHFDLRELTVSEFLRYPAGLAKSGLTNHNLTDDVRFQTDENLTAGLTTSPAGNNDLVLLVDLTAGNVDFEIVLEYDIE